MATKIAWGCLDEDGNVLSGSGDFTVSEESEPGFYDIFFSADTFSVQPAITGSCVSDSREAPVFQVYQLNGPKGLTAETRDAHTGKRHARAGQHPTPVGGRNRRSIVGQADGCGGQLLG